METDLTAPSTSRPGGLRPWFVLLVTVPALASVDVGDGATGLFLGYFAAALLLLPATPLDLACGAVLGLAPGIVCAQVAATLAAATAFAVSRTLLQERVRPLVRRDARLRRLERALGRRGWRTVLLARAAPGLPFGLLSWVLGASRVPAGVHLAATFVATLPKTIAHVALGAGAGHLIEDAGPQALPAALAVMALVALVPIWLARRRRALTAP